MRPNDETIYGDSTILDENQPQVENDSKKKPAWATIGLGAATGILMGAGAIYAATSKAADTEETTPAGNEEANMALPEENTEESATSPAENEATVAPEATETPQVTAAAPSVNHEAPAFVGHVEVASVTPGTSFADAFAEARAEVGPGGVFHWRGGIYNTYTQEEWNSMSDAQKHQFASRINPEYSVSDIKISEITVEHPQVYVNADEVHIYGQGEDDVHLIGYLGDEDVIIDDQNVNIEHFTIDGHQAAIINYEDENEHSIAILDKNGNGTIDDGEAMDLVTGDLLTADLTPLAVEENSDDASEPASPVAPEAPVTPDVAENDMAESDESVAANEEKEGETIAASDETPEATYHGEADVMLDGKEAHVEAYTVNGHQAAIVSFKDEDTHDIAIVDTNDNEELDDGEAMDLETGDLLNSDLSPMAPSTDDLAEVTDQTCDL